MIEYTLSILELLGISALSIGFGILISFLCRKTY